jgi:signal transduction histidine kinase
LRVTSHVVHIGALVVAVAGVTATDGLSLDAALATLFASVAVLLSFFVPIPMDRRDTRAYVALIGGVVLETGAMALSGGIGSPFVVMPLATIFLAAIAGGVTTAAPIALLGVGGVLLATWTSGTEAGADALVRIPAIYIITAIAFSEVQRALLSESERAEDLALATSASSHRRARMEETHDLLEDLLAVATSPDINAVAAAQDALRDVGLVIPDATSRILGPGGVVLARRGETPDSAPTDSIPIERSGRHVAQLELWHDGAALTPSQRSAIQSTAASVGLALENDVMVQRLAGLTIQRERVRLARELHDEIAPSIASVGLALDMVMLAGDLSPDQERTLDATRSNVTGLVDRIRDRVQDLRADRSVSVVERAHSLVAEVDIDGPTVVVDIDERTPPRPAIATEVGALMTEAFRNALTHAGASVIRISGRIDDREGVVRVEDNGNGFDHGEPVDGRYGLVGMQERAGLIGATLEVVSREGEGTRVEVAWEDLR